MGEGAWSSEVTGGKISEKVQTYSSADNVSIGPMDITVVKDTISYQRYPFSALHGHHYFGPLFTWC